MIEAYFELYTETIRDLKRKQKNLKISQELVSNFFEISLKPFFSFFAFRVIQIFFFSDGGDEILEHSIKLKSGSVKVSQPQIIQLSQYAFWAIRRILNDPQKDSLENF